MVSGGPWGLVPPSDLPRLVADPRWACVRVHALAHSATRSHTVRASAEWGLYVDIQSPRRHRVRHTIPTHSVSYVAKGVQGRWCVCDVGPVMILNFLACIYWERGKSMLSTARAGGAAPVCTSELPSRKVALRRSLNHDRQRAAARAAGVADAVAGRWVRLERRRLLPVSLGIYLYVWTKRAR